MDKCEEVGFMKAKGKGKGKGKDKGRLWQMK